MIMTNLDILVLLLVVAVIFSKLKSLLGTRPEEGVKPKVNSEEAETLLGNLFNEVAKKHRLKIETIQENENVSAEKVVNLSETEKALLEIPGFDKVVFVDNAMKAFEIITNAFSKGDVETLEMLVNKTLFKKFQEIIDQRKNDKITAETDFICFDKAEIVNASINKNGVARIMVEFVTQQVNVLRDDKDEVIEGDEQFIQTITDVWSFERAISSTTPNWLLVSTKK